VIARAHSRPKLGIAVKSTVVSDGNRTPNIEREESVEIQVREREDAFASTRRRMR